jgi:hypothetical protein
VEIRVATGDIVAMDKALDGVTLTKACGGS